MNIALVGDMSSGKSTLLNAMLGEIVAETGYDRSTTTVQVYCETIPSKHIIKKKKSKNISVSKSEIDHNKVLKDTRDLNEKEQMLNAEETTQYNSKFLKFRQPKPGRKLHNIPMHDVAVSSLIEQKNDYDNVFRIFDFPGFGDPKLQQGVKSAIMDYFEKFCKEFDYIFYLFDCKNCLKTESSLNDFNKTFEIIERNNLNDKIHIRFIINKFDTIKISEAGNQFVQEQIDLIKSKLDSAQISIPEENYQFYNISANELLMQRIIKEKDSEFVEKFGGKERITLEDLIHDFASNFMGKWDIQEMIKQNLTVAQKIKTIHDEMKEKEKQIQLREEAKALAAQSDEKVDEKEDEKQDMQQQSQLSTQSQNQRNKTTRPASSRTQAKTNAIRDNTDDFLQFLRDLRRFRHNVDKAKDILKKIEMKRSDHILEFFVCVYCLLCYSKKLKETNEPFESVQQEAQNMVVPLLSKMVGASYKIPTNINSNGKVNGNANSKLSKGVKKLSKRFERIRNVKYRLDISLNPGSHKREIQSFVILALKHFPQIWDLLDRNTFDFDGLIKVFVERNVIDKNTFPKLEKRIDLTKYKDYYDQIGYCYTKHQIGFYTRNNDIISKKTSDLIITQIHKFSQTNEEKLKLLLCLLVNYPSARTATPHMGVQQPQEATCRVVDLLPYFVDTRKFARMFDYKDYKEICGKLVCIKDEVFDCLIEEVTKFMNA